jgi:hypothetical protein
VQQGVDLFGQGFDFICYSGDVWVLHDALKDAINKLREGCIPAEKPKKAGSKRGARRFASPCPVISATQTDHLSIPTSTSGH